MFHKQERKVMAAGSSPLPVALVLTHSSCQVMLKDDMGGKPVLLGHGAGTAALQGVWRWWQSCQKGCSNVGSLGLAHAVLYVPSSAPPDRPCALWLQALPQQGWPWSDGHLV